MPVNVLKGRIRGKQRVPIEQYMPKPEEEYGEDAQFLPEGYQRTEEMDGGGVSTDPARGEVNDATNPTASTGQPKPSAKPTSIPAARITAQ